MLRMLVTGGAGFIGANFVHYWHEKYPEDRIVVLDALTYAGNLANLEPIQNSSCFRFVHGDIRDERLLEVILAEESIDTIVHFAAETHVDRSIVGPDPFLQTNVLGTNSLLKCAHKFWIDGSARSKAHRFHHVSTDEVYGSLEPDEPAFTESTRFAPNSPYAASKAASDHLVRAYHRTHGLQVTTSNCSNNYGPYQFLEKLIPLFIINTLTGEPLPLYGDGQNVRDWVHVNDHCHGIDLVLRNGRVGDCYNIGGGTERSNIEIALLICKLIDDSFAAHPDLTVRFPRSPAIRSNSASLLRYVDDRLGHDRRYAVNTTKITTDLGFATTVTFESGLRKTVDWYLNNEKWWRHILDRPPHEQVIYKGQTRHY